MATIEVKATYDSGYKEIIFEAPFNRDEMKRLFLRNSALNSSISTFTVEDPAEKLKGRVSFRVASYDACGELVEKVNAAFKETGLPYIVNSQIIKKEN
jgi:hypothetical protein